jgi:ABC-type Fe3+-hydroxamate transport system substrate-binding protein
MSAKYASLYIKGVRVEHRNRWKECFAEEAEIFERSSEAVTKVSAFYSHVTSVRSCNVVSIYSLSFPLKEI